MAKISVTDEAIVLGRKNFGEHDRIFTLLTQSHGKITCFAAHARNSQKRFGPAFDLFSRVNARLTPHKTQSGLWRLEKCDLIDIHLGLRKDILKLSIASYLSEVISTFVAEGEDQADIYAWWRDVLYAIENQPLPLRTLVKWDYEFLSLIGYQPNFNACHSCGSIEDKTTVFFSYNGGHIYCRACHTPSPGGWVSLSEDVLSYLNSKTEENIEWSNKNVLRLCDLMQGFVNFQLGYRPRSQNLRWEILQDEL